MKGMSSTMNQFDARPVLVPGTVGNLGDMFKNITTPLMGGEGQNVTVHFNVCKTSRLEN